MEKDSLHKRYVSFKKNSENQIKEYKKNFEETSALEIKKCLLLNLNLIAERQKNNSFLNAHDQFYLKHYNPHVLS